LRCSAMTEIQDAENARIVRTQLADNGLKDPIFKVDAITRDFVMRLQMDRELDQLIGPNDFQEPLLFSSGNPK